jgi:hypothetical protein
LSTQNIKDQIKDAALVAKQMNKYAEELLDNVESGDSLKALIRVIPESRFPKWATTLASLLCSNPELANNTNKDLAALIANEDGEYGLDYTIISKKLSAGQRHLVVEILQNHGYATDTLRNGTDIKTIVKNNIRTESPKDDGVIFYADGLSILGKRYSYRQRPVTPDGTPWHDFCVRLAGDDTSLKAVLAARGIGINGFINRDEAACASASPEEAARRHKLDRPAKEPRRLAKGAKAAKAVAVEGPNKNGSRAVAGFSAMRIPEPGFDSMSALLAAGLH